MKAQPLAAAGIPVFQGQNFLDDTLHHLREQTYGNLEILVCDNASTDDTVTIAKEHAAADARVKVKVNETNLGAAENYNTVFRESNGKYFAWNAHDDYSSPDYFEAAVAALEANPHCAVAIPRSFRIDVDGAKLEEFEIPPDLFSDKPHVRFRTAAHANPATVVFGVFRRSIIEGRPPHGHFSGSDRNFVADILLQGPPVMAGDAEFYLREHPGRSVRTYHRRGNRYSHGRDAWFDPQRTGRIVFPAWRRLGRYVLSVSRTRLGPAESARCYLAVFSIMGQENFRLTKQLAYDLVTAVITTAKRLRPR